MSTHSTYLDFKSNEKALGYKLFESLKPRYRLIPNHGSVSKSSRHHYKIIRALDVRELHPRSRAYLFANNPEPRGRFAPVFLDTVTSHLKSPAHQDRLNCPEYLV